MLVDNTKLTRVMFISIFISHIYYTNQISSPISCGTKWSCEHYTESDNTTESYFSRMNCHCDELCSLFRDCCPDAPTLSTATIEEFPQSSISCASLTEWSKVDNLYMITKCPPSWEDGNIKERCENETADLLLRLPVMGHETTLTYRNMYCAICHRNTYTYWIPSVFCITGTENIDDIPPNATLLDIANNKGCDIKFLPPDNKTLPRPCLQYEINNKCNPAFNESFVVESCENTTQMKLVYSTSKAWSNVACALCNFETKLYCTHRFLSTSPFVTFPSGPYSLSILLDLNTGSRSSTVGTELTTATKNYTDFYTCDTGEIFDPFIRTCRTVICGGSMVYTGGGCWKKNFTSGSANISECPRIELHESEYELVENNTLLELVSGRLYEESEFFVRGNSAFVCSNLTQNYTNVRYVDNLVMRLTLSPTEGIVTATGLSLSLLALAGTIFIYARFQPLRNIPGKNLLSLSISLFTAELLMLTAPFAARVPFVCKSVAMAMHYFFLVAFFWMNVMAVDVWLTFSKGFVKVDASTKSCRRFRFYSMYSWGMPVLIMVASLLVNYLPLNSPFQPGYGLGLCWFSNKVALLVFFAGPLLLILLLNIGFFIAAASNICLAKRSSRKYLQKQEATDIFIYIRLFLVMGLTWTVGFLATFVSHPVLWYLFAILNSLQGFFIFLSFVATKRVVNLTKREILGSKHSYESTTSNVASITSTTRI